MGADRAWSVRIAMAWSSMPFVILLLFMPATMVLGLAYMVLDWPGTASPPLGYGFLALGVVVLGFAAMLGWEALWFKRHYYRCHRTYSLTPEEVDTAVRLLLASRRAGSAWRRDAWGFRYLDAKVGDESMVMTLRPCKDGGTVLRVYNDIFEDDDRAKLMADIDAAVESPYGLDLSGALEVEEPPELHVFED